MAAFIASSGGDDTLHEIKAYQDDNLAAKVRSSILQNFCCPSLGHDVEFRALGSTVAGLLAEHRELGCRWLSLNFVGDPSLRSPWIPVDPSSNDKSLGSTGCESETETTWGAVKGCQGFLSHRTSAAMEDAA